MQTDKKKSLEELIIKGNVDFDAIYQEVNLPTLLARVKALVADFLIVLTVFVATTYFISFFGDISDFSRGFIFVFMVYLYDPLLTSLTGSTFGHKMMGLKVRKYLKPDEKLSVLQAFLRFFIKVPLGWLSFLTVTGTKHKRAIHDIMSGSIVLKV